MARETLGREKERAVPVSTKLIFFPAFFVFRKPNLKGRINVACLPYVRHALSDP